MIGETAELLLANETFYEAFAAGDIDAMDGLWARAKTVACVHPGQDVLVGRETVMGSWRAILGSADATGFRCERPQVTLLGSDTGFVTCIERFGPGRLLATNVFVRENDRWHMVHHHAGPLPPE